MARLNDSTEGINGDPPNTDNKRASYIAGNPDSTPELIQFMNCETTDDLKTLPTQVLIIAALQAKNTISDWESRILSDEEKMEELQNQVKEQQAVITYLERNRTTQT